MAGIYHIRCGVKIRLCELTPARLMLFAEQADTAVVLEETAGFTVAATSVANDTSITVFKPHRVTDIPGKDSHLLEALGKLTSQQVAQTHEFLAELRDHKDRCVTVELQLPKQAEEAEDTEVMGVQSGLVKLVSLDRSQVWHQDINVLEELPEARMPAGVTGKSNLNPAAAGCQVEPQGHCFFEAPQLNMFGRQSS